MKGKIVLEFSAKEAVAMISNPTTPKSLVRKIVTAFQAAPVTPAGAKQSVVARAKTATKKKATTGHRSTAHVGKAEELNGATAN